MVMEQSQKNGQNHLPQIDSVGSEVENAINDGYFLECEPQSFDCYMVKEKQSDDANLTFGKIISRHIDLDQEHIVFRILLSDGRHAHYIFNWAESYSIDGY